MQRLWIIESELQNFRISSPRELPNLESPRLPTQMQKEQIDKVSESLFSSHGFMASPSPNVTYGHMKLIENIIMVLKRYGHVM